MIRRHYHLSRIQPQLSCNVFQRIYGGAVDVGLTSLPQPAVTHGDAEALEQALERCRTTELLDKIGAYEAAVNGDKR